MWVTRKAPVAQGGRFSRPTVAQIGREPAW